MNAINPAPSISEPADPDLAHCRRVLVRGVALMGELQEMAVDCAKQGLQPLAEAVAQLDTLTRSVRRSTMLVERLGRPAKPLPLPAAEREMKRRVVIRRVEDQIQEEAQGEDAERLERELHERMDAPEFDIELDLRNIDQVIKDILHDLGLDDPHGCGMWKRRPPSVVRKLWDLAERRAREGLGPVGSGPPEGVGFEGGVLAGGVGEGYRPP